MDEQYIDLKEYIKDTIPVLCYFTSELHCKQCVDSYFSVIREFISTYNIQVVFLGNYKNRNDLNLFFRLNRFKGKIITIPDKKCTLLNPTSPLLFVYHPAMNRVSEVFKPEISDLDAIKRYLNIIYRKYYLFNTSESL